MLQAGVDRVKATDRDLERFIGQEKIAAQVAAQASSETLPWMLKEELVVTEKHQQDDEKRPRALRKVAALLAVLALVFPIARASSAFSSSMKTVQLEKQHLA